MPTYQSSLACLETIVGLAQNNCPCNTHGRPVNYAESLSGLFIDDYEHGLADVFTKTAQGCGDGSMWDVLAKARYEGVNDGVTYLLRAIGQNLNKFVDGFSGTFGEVNSRTANTPDRSCNKDITGFTVKPNVYNGASMKFKKLWLALDTAGTYEVSIHDLADLTTPVTTVSIVHPGGNKMVGVEITDGYRIQPLSEAGQPITYAVSYERNGSLPLNYTYYCGCGEAHKPMWMKNKYLESRGFCVDSLDDIIPGTSSCNRDFTGGLILEWEMICDPAQWLCTRSVNSAVYTIPEASIYPFSDPDFVGTYVELTGYTGPDPGGITEAQGNLIFNVYVGGNKQYYRTTATQIGEFSWDNDLNRIVFPVAIDHQSVVINAYPQNYVLSFSDGDWWKTSAWGRIAAKMFQLVITQKAIAAILESGRVNFYTMFSAEMLQEKRLAFSKLTDELVLYLAENMPSDVNHCWSCKQEQNFSKRTIKV